MLVTIMICSDPECAEPVELWGELEELEATLCECGCALQAIAFCEGTAEAATLPLPLAA
jgi:hypothetical protein